MTRYRERIDLVEAAIPDALAMVGAVRDDPSEVERLLWANTEPDLQRLYALTIALAALVPDDRSAVELLSWMPGAYRPREAMTDEECREAHAAWIRGDRRDVDGEREYQKRRKAARKDAA